MNLLRPLVAGVLVFGAFPACAQDYPAKTVRIIVAYTPGGGTDLVGRVLAKKLGEAWGQQVIVENRVGAGGNIGTELMAKAVPDGYTLGISPSTQAIAPSLYAKLPFDTMKDFTYITLAAAGPNILVVHPSLPVTTVKEFVALAKRRPGELTFASAGVGATTHLAGEYLKSVAGIDVLHIPYKGSSQAQIDLVGGQVQFMVDSMPSGLPRVQIGKTRALATTGKKRFSGLPNVPTVMESGLPYESVSWWGVVGPANLPPAIVNKLVADIAKAVAQADAKEILASQGAEPTTSTPQQFLDYVKQETALYAKIIKDAKIPVQP